MTGAQDNTIGGNSPSEGNLISANGYSGVEIADTGTMSNKVAWNRIGTDATGTLDLGNGSEGIRIDSGAENNAIGEGNVISGNENCGVNLNASATAGNRVTEE